jgi:hypothetical protein
MSGSCSDGNSSRTESNVAFELFNLAGKRALVTGSFQGIGLALARGLADHGASVILNGRDRNKLDAAVASLTAGGHEVANAGFDVTDADAVREGVAGMQFRSPLADFPAEKWERRSEDICNPRMTEVPCAPTWEIGAKSKHGISRGCGAPQPMKMGIYSLAIPL